MSWDLLAFRAPLEFKSPRKEDLPAGWEPTPFGLRSEVQAKLCSLLPGIRFNFHKETLWGSWSARTCSLEISLGDSESIIYLWFAARGEMDEVLAAITEILDAFELRGVDLQVGEFFQRERAQVSFQEWRKSVERFRGLKGNLTS